MAKLLLKIGNYAQTFSIGEPYNRNIRKASDALYLVLVESGNMLY